MDILYSLAMGFHVALSPQNLAFCLIGATIGTVVGVLPGIGPVTTIAMLIPLTFQMPAIGSLIMLAGIYYGSHHAGSTTAIMLNMPGEPSAVVVCLDGHPLAKKGKAGSTLAMSAIASFCAGCVGFLIVAALSPELSTLSLMFGPTEYFATIVMALVMASVLTENNLLTTLGMCMFGLLLGAVGMDLTTGDERYAFGIPDLADGVNFVAVAVGLYAFTEIIEYLGSETRTARVHAKIESLIPTRDDLEALVEADHPRHHARLDPRHLPRHRAADQFVRRLCRWNGASPRIPRASARARSKAWWRRNPPPMPRRSPTSSRC